MAAAGARARRWHEGLVWRAHWGGRGAAWRAAGRGVGAALGPGGGGRKNRLAAALPTYTPPPTHPRGPQAWGDAGTALMLNERLINAPPALAPPLMQALLDEVAWATEDEPTQVGSARAPAVCLRAHAALGARVPCLTRAVAFAAVAPAPQELRGPFLVHTCG